MQCPWKRSCTYSRLLIRTHHHLCRFLYVTSLLDDLLVFRLLHKVLQGVYGRNIHYDVDIIRSLKLVAVIDSLNLGVFSRFIMAVKCGFPLSSILYLKTGYDFRHRHHPFVMCERADCAISA